MYDNPPYIEIPITRKDCSSGWDAINSELKKAIKKIDKKKVVLTVECHHGTFEEVNFNALKRGLKPQASCKSAHIFKEKNEILEMISHFLSNDGMANQYTGLQIDDYFDSNKKEALQENIEQIEEGLVLIFGIGACHVWDADLVVFADMSQWEVQQRFKRHDIDNIGLPNSQYSFDYQYKWAFFNDWPLCNEIRKAVLPKCDYYLETNNWARPNLVQGEKLREGLQIAARQPFKIAPFYDPLLWDETIQTEQEEANIEWCFSCIPEEGNLLFKTESTLFEVPFLSLIACWPELILGNKTIQQFGNNLPIYLDFIDTQDTGETRFQFLPTNNISHLQPERFYYFLESETKSTITTGQFRVQNSGQAIAPRRSFESQVSSIEPHHYIHLPNGVPIQIGEQVIALLISNVSGKFINEIYPTQYIHSEEINNRQWDHNDEVSLHQSSIPESTLTVVEEKLLPKHLKNLEISRCWFQSQLVMPSRIEARIINLIQGDQVEISSKENRFSAQIINYGETFIIPSNCGELLFSVPPSQNKPCAILQISAKLPQA